MTILIIVCKNLITLNVTPVIGEEIRKQGGKKKKSCFNIKSAAKSLVFIESFIYLHQRVIAISEMCFFQVLSMVSTQNNAEKIFKATLLDQENQIVIPATTFMMLNVTPSLFSLNYAQFLAHIHINAHKLMHLRIIVLSNPKVTLNQLTN